MQKDSSQLWVINQRHGDSPPARPLIGGAWL